MSPNGGGGREVSVASEQNNSMKRAGKIVKGLKRRIKRG